MSGYCSLPGRLFKHLKAAYLKLNSQYSSNLLQLYLWIIDNVSEMSDGLKSSLLIKTWKNNV